MYIYHFINTPEKQVIKHIFKYAQKARLTIYNKVPVKVLYSSHFFTRSNNTDKKDSFIAFPSGKQA